MLSGSVAMSTYVVPRATKDLDFVAHIKPADIQRMVDFFKEGFYCDEDSVKDAVQRRSMFNIIDYKSGFKADFVLLKNELFRQEEFNRRRSVDFFGMEIFIVSPEDLLISKLIWIQDLQSHQQKDDIKSLLAMPNLDKPYIDRWLMELKLNTFGLIS